MPGTKKSAKPRGRTPRLGRVDLVRNSTDETVADLAKRLASSRRKPSVRTQVPLGSLRIAERVFQWRREGFGLTTSQDHALALTKALQNSNKPFEPILVFPVGKHLYVVDGHHRVTAYRTVKWSRRVPVEVFRGTLEEARIEGFKRNSKDKLPMSAQDKMEGAWTLVKEATMTAEKLHDVTGVSTRQVFYMRRVLKWLQEQDKKRPGGLKRAIRDLSWKQARRMLESEEPVDFDMEDWKEKKAQKLVDELLKAKLGQGLMKHPDVTALALERLNANLPKALLRQWFTPEDLLAIAEEERAYDL